MDRWPAIESVADWITTDLLRTTLLVALVVAVCVVVVQARVPAGKLRLPVWRIVLAVGWIAAVLVAGVLSRLDPDLQICKASTVVTDPSKSTETSRNAADEVTGKTTTRAERTAQSTETCEPLSVAEMAVLSVPFLILISPILKGFNVAGLFGFDFREFQEKVVTEAKDQVIRVIVEHDIGAKTKKAVLQAEEGRVSNLPEQ